MLNLSTAFQRLFYNKSDPDRLRKLESYIDRALGRSGGSPTIALENLITLADSESELGDLVSDVCAVAFVKWFAITSEHLQLTT